ncbi:hypothetical protein IAT38_002073 [Cryptococcus sp. DSM 104549]
MSAPLRPIARASRPLLRRGYAVGPDGIQIQDPRGEIIRNALYPRDSYAPTSSSPTGVRHPKHMERLREVLPSAEAHETIERAWQLYQRQLRNARKAELQTKFDKMVEACDELERITNSANGGPYSADGKGGEYHRAVYDRAVLAMRQAKRGEPVGKKTMLQTWMDSRVEGLFPRESWVPTETRGKGWNYNWSRPKGEPKV